MLVETQRMNPGAMVQPSVPLSRPVPGNDGFMTELKIGDEPTISADFNTPGLNGFNTSVNNNQQPTAESDALILSKEEIRIITDLDSRAFGFIDLKSPEEKRRRTLVVKAVQHLEKQLILAKEQGNDEDGKSGSKSRFENVDPKIFCKLGHLNLLLGDYAKALSAYQKYNSLKEDNWKDPAFLYGLGLVYYHFGAFQCPHFAPELRGGHGWKNK